MILGTEITHTVDNITWFITIDSMVYNIQETQVVLDCCDIKHMNQWNHIFWDNGFTLVYKLGIMKVNVYAMDITKCLYESLL